MILKTLRIRGVRVLHTANEAVSRPGDSGWSFLKSRRFKIIGLQHNAFAETPRRVAPEQLWKDGGLQPVARASETKVFIAERFAGMDISGRCNASAGQDLHFLF